MVSYCHTFISDSLTKLVFVFEQASGKSRRRKRQETEKGSSDSSSSIGSSSNDNSSSSSSGGEKLSTCAQNRICLFLGLVTKKAMLIIKLNKRRIRRHLIRRLSTLGPKHPSTGELNVVQKRELVDFEASQL